MTDLLAAPPLALGRHDPAPRLILPVGSELGSSPPMRLGRRAKKALIVTACVMTLASTALGGVLYVRSTAQAELLAAGFEPDADGLLQALSKERVELLPTYRRLGIKAGTTPRAIEAAVLSGSSTVLAAVIEEGARVENEPNAARLAALAIQSKDLLLLDSVLKMAPLDAAAVAGVYSALRTTPNWPAFRRLAREPGLRSYKDNAGNGLVHLAASAPGADDWAAVASAPGLDVKAVNARGESALHVAATAGNADMVRAVLASGLDPLQANGRGQTAMALAYAEGADTALAVMAHGNKAAASVLAENMESLVDKGLRQTIVALATQGVSLNEPGSKGLTPLARAVSRDDLALVAALLENNANPNAASTVPGAGGVTPLMLASLRGSEPIVRALLARGALPALAASNGATALALATRNGHRNVMELLQR